MAILNRLTSLCGRMFGKPNDTAALHDNMSATSLMKMRVGKCTSIGNFRDNNEDRLFVDEDRQVFIVADGMGGQAAGEQASQIAVDLIPKQLLNLTGNLAGGGNSENPDEIRQAVSEAVMAANEAIIAQGQADPSVQNMGTTVVMAVFRGQMLYVAHLGDSVAYQLRDGKILTLTTDHNLAQALFDAKTITKEELKHHRFKHVLWKYLGSKEALDGPDIGGFEVKAGDRIVLATDGVTGVLEPENILEQNLKFNDPQQCADNLVRHALDSGSKDNVTCVVIFVDAL